MKKLLILGIGPLLAGVMLYAQTDPVNVNPASYMITNGCFFQRNQQTRLVNGNLNVSVVTATNCPVQQTHSEIGVVAPNGRFVPLAPVSHPQLITRVRKHHRWETTVAQTHPINVVVRATPEGSVVVQPLH